MFQLLLLQRMPKIDKVLLQCRQRHLISIIRVYIFVFYFIYVQSNELIFVVRNQDTTGEFFFGFQCGTEIFKWINWNFVLIQVCSVSFILPISNERWYLLNVNKLASLTYKDNIISMKTPCFRGDTRDVKCTSFILSC